MATLTITNCTIVEIIDGHDYPFAEAATEGQYVRPNTTSARYELGNATTAAEIGNRGGLLCSADAAIGDIGYVMHKGLVDVGDALDALDPDEAVYLTNTDGTLGDLASAGTVSTIVGYVEARWANPDGTPDKLLFLNL